MGVIKFGPAGGPIPRSPLHFRPFRRPREPGDRLRGWASHPRTVNGMSPAYKRHRTRSGPGPGKGGCAQSMFYSVWDTPRSRGQPGGPKYGPFCPVDPGWDLDPLAEKSAPPPHHPLRVAHLVYLGMVGRGGGGN